MSVNSPDILIIGAGACGCLMANKLAARGFSVMVLEAGKRLNPATDLSNAAANSSKIMWTQPRVHAGKDGIVPKTGFGVGGRTLTWLGVMPRFHAAVEREFGVAGECGPWAPEPYQLPMPPHRMNWHAQVLARGARRLGAQPFAPPIAINSVAFDGRPASTYCGWCGSGCARTPFQSTRQSARIFQTTPHGCLRIVSDRSRRVAAHRLPQALHRQRRLPGFRPTANSQN